MYYLKLVQNSAQNLCRVDEACTKLDSSFTENSINFSGDRDWTFQQKTLPDLYYICTLQNV